MVEERLENTLRPQQQSLDFWIVGGQFLRVLTTKDINNLPITDSNSDSELVDGLRIERWGGGDADAEEPMCTVWMHNRVLSV